MQKSRRRVIGFFVVLAVLSPLILVAFYVEDWSRDLTTNTAATARTAVDPALRPPLIEANAGELAAAVEAFCASDPSWQAGDGRSAPADSAIPAPGDGSGVFSTHLIRTTGVMRYRDDVWVVAEDAGEGRLRVNAESRSRVGKGDLGQNPRNLRELLGSLRARFGASE